MSKITFSVVAFVALLPHLASSLKLTDEEKERIAQEVEEDGGVENGVENNAKFQLPKMDDPVIVGEEHDPQLDENPFPTDVVPSFGDSTHAPPLDDLNPLPPPPPALSDNKFLAALTSLWTGACGVYRAILSIGLMGKIILWVLAILLALILLKLLFRFLKKDRAFDVNVLPRFASTSSIAGSQASERTLYREPSRPTWRGARYQSSHEASSDEDNWY